MKKIIALAIALSLATARADNEYVGRTFWPPGPIPLGAPGSLTSPAPIRVEFNPNTTQPQRGHSQVAAYVIGALAGAILLDLVWHHHPRHLSLTGYAAPRALGVSLTVQR
jgi:hypothetical protein